VVVLGGLLALVGAGLWARSDGSGSSTVSTYPYDETSCDNPMPPIVVRTGIDRIELGGAFNPAPKPDDDSFASIACDYGWPTDVEHLGTTATGFTIDFVPTWELTATYTLGPCLVQRPAEVTSDGEGHHTVGVAGPAASYRVQINARGPEGSISTAFGIATTQAGPEPAPGTDASAYSSDDMQAFGFTLILYDLAPSHLDAARLRVTDASGQEVEVPMANRGEPEDDACRFDLEVAAADEPRIEALDAVPITFHYEVVLDGTTHVAQSTYPDDLDPETTSFHPAFDPPLPALPDP
jgi:hypothetical protein